MREILLNEVREDIKDLYLSSQSLREELIYLKAARLDKCDDEIKRIWKSINDPKKSRSAIFNRVIIALIVTASLALFTWIGEVLYKTPSPDQQKTIYSTYSKIGKPALSKA